MNTDDIQFLDVKVDNDVIGLDAMEYVQNVTNKFLSNVDATPYLSESAILLGVRVWLTISVLAAGVFSYMYIQAYRAERALHARKKTR